MSHTLQDLTERLLNAAKKSGADDADAMAIQGQSLSINVRGGQLEQAERAEGCLLYTSPSQRARTRSRMPSTA